MGVLSAKNKTGQWNGTASSTATELDVTQSGNGLAAPRVLSLQNTGDAQMLYSTTGGVTWNTMESGASYVWEAHSGVVFELLVKTTSPDETTYQADASY